MRREPVLRNTPLPLAVRRYIRWAGVDETRPVRALRMTHAGKFRMGLRGPWIDIRGQLDLETDPLARHWRGTMRPFPFVRLTGADSYERGSGRLDIELFERYRVASAAGRETTQAELVTLLAELPLTPTALLPSESLRWSFNTSCSARAILRDGNLSVSGIFHFAPDGRPLRFESADRFRQRGKEFVRTLWIARYHNFRTVDGMQLPVDMEAAWIIGGEEISYARFKATSLTVRYDAARSDDTAR